MGSVVCDLGRAGAHWIEPTLTWYNITGDLQTACIVAASPISAIMLLMTWGLVKPLPEDSCVAPDSGAELAPDGTGLKAERRS